MGKKRKRIKPLKSRPVYAPGEAESRGIQSFTRIEAMVDILETAIWLWVLEKSPCSMHLLVMSQYRCIQDLIKGKEDFIHYIPDKTEPEQLNRVYDWLRHSSSNPHTGADFTADVTAGILYDVICSFNQLYSTTTVSMEAFLAHFVLWLAHHQDPSHFEMALHQLPAGVTAQDFLVLNRKPFFDKLYRAFREQAG